MLIRQINQATDGGENRHAFFLWIIEEKMEILAKINVRVCGHLMLQWNGIFTSLFTDACRLV